MVVKIPVNRNGLIAMHQLRKEKIPILGTGILVASLKQLDQIIYCASLGVAAVTIKPDLYHSLMADHPIVEGFTERFLSDWFQAHGSLSLNKIGRS